MQIDKISTDDLRTFIEGNEGHLLDVRPIDAYNGWSLRNETRGGHIKGAKTLPAKWADYLDWIEIIRSKNIRPDHQIVLYGYDDADIDKVAQKFAETGYDNLCHYPRFVDEWSTNTDLPMDQLPRYERLVPPKWVQTITTGNRPQNIVTGDVVLCHAHYRNREAYISGHLPGAIDIDTRALESTDTWNRHSPEKLEKALLEHGITADTTVVLYGKFLFPDNDDPYPGSAAGHLGAIRCACIMLYAGVKDVRVLNGGFQSWKDAGFEISTEDVQKTPKKEFGAEIPVNPHIMIDSPEAKELLTASGGELVSVRSWPEYIGEVSGYNYIEKKGRIPGSVFGSCGTDAYHMENYRNVDHTTREYHEIAAMLEEAGITPDKKLAFYCGTGWRGSEAFYNAWLMGWPDVAIYDGGWFEWSNDPGNPIETGKYVTS